MRLRLFVILILSIYLLSCVPVSFAEDKVNTVKLEAENAKGNYVIVEAAEASGSKFIGIDHTINEENNFRYSVVYENAPKTTSINMVYATPGAGDVVIYVENNGKNTAIGAINFAPSGDWNPYGGQELEAVAEGLNILEGSKVTMIATGSVNIDYFEFIYNEEEVVKPVDGKQKDEIKELNNVFISDLVWLNSSCHNQDASFSVHKDRNYLYEQLTVAGTAYDKGLGMLSGHYEGSVFVEVDIEGLGFTTFASYVGVDDKTVPNLIDSSVQFVVEVDGVEKVRSSILKKEDEPELLKVDVTGAKKLRLYTSPAGDGIALDCCVWGSAALGKTANIEEIFATPTPAPTVPVGYTPSPILTSTPNVTNIPKARNKDNNIIFPAILVSSLVVIAVIVVIIITRKKK